MKNKISHSKEQFNIICNSFLDVNFKNITPKGSVRVLLFSNDFKKYSKDDMKILLNRLVLVECTEINFVGRNSDNLHNNKIYSTYENEEKDYEWAVASFVQDSYQNKNKNTCDLIVYDDEKLLNYFLKNHYSWPMLNLN